MNYNQAAMEWRRSKRGMKKGNAEGEKRLWMKLMIEI
jgi:hypothetical protein